MTQSPEPKLPIKLKTNSNAVPDGLSLETVTSVYSQPIQPVAISFEIRRRQCQADANEISVQSQVMSYSDIPFLDENSNDMKRQ
jgi:hypothetical protein